jgi:hypothetical protein
MNTANPNHNQMRIENTSLLILIDSFESGLNDCTHLINLLNNKLNLLNIKLGQIHILTKNEQNKNENIIEQLKLIQKNLTNTNAQELIMVTTTNEENNCYINNLIEQVFGKNKENNYNNNNYSIINNNLNETEQTTSLITLKKKLVFLLDKKSFHSNLAVLFNDLLKLKELSENRVEISFSGKEKLEKFMIKFNKTFELNIQLNMQSIKEFENEKLKLINKFNNYSILVEVNFFDYNSYHIFMLNFLNCGDFELSNLLLDNFVNADYYVYEFAQFTRNINANKKLEDIQFLLNKIDYNLFLSKLEHSIKTIEESFKEYKSEEICVSFNGGKDCCVVLYLFYAVALRLGIRLPLSLLFVQIKNQFEEMNDFIENIFPSFYAKGSIEFIKFDETKTIKQSLNELKTIRPNMKAILLGTRKSDGKYFQTMPTYAPTDGIFFLFYFKNINKI